MTRSMLFNSLKSLAAALLLAAIILFGLTFAVSGTEDPARYLTLIAYASMLVPALTGGILTTLFNREKGLIGGAFTGAMLGIIIFTVSLILSRSPDIGKLVLAFILITALSAFGGFIALPRGKSIKKRRKELMKR